MVSYVGFHEIVVNCIVLYKAIVLDADHSRKSAEAILLQRCSKEATLTPLAPTFIKSTYQNSSTNSASYFELL